MKKNYLKLSGNRSNFYSLALKFKNLSNKIDELMNTGKFWEFSKNEQDRLVGKLRKLFEKLSSFNPSYALKIAGAAMCFALISNNANAGLFSEWPDNPLDGISVTTAYDGAFADIDGDGDDDAIILGACGMPLYFENVNGVFTANSAESPFPLWSGTSFNYAYQGTGIDIADFDGDNDLDAIIINGWSSGHITHFQLSSGVFTENSGDFINSYSSGYGFYFWNGYKAKFGDVDDDGDLDIVVPFCGSYLISLIQQSNHTFSQSYGVPYCGSIGSVNSNTHINMADMDGDGDDDLFVFNPTPSGPSSPGALNDATSNIQYFENGSGSGLFIQTTSNIPLPLAQMSDSDFSLLVDLDGDGDIDVFTPNAPAATSNLQNGAAAAVPVSPLIALALFVAGGFGIFRRNRKKNKA